MVREDRGSPNGPPGRHVDVDAVIDGVADAEGDADVGEVFEGGCGA